MKDKAKELVDKFYNEIWSLHKKQWSSVHYDIAKQCALICVEENIESYLKGFSTSHIVQKLAKNNFHYKELEQLKQEIEKL